MQQIMENSVKDPMPYKNTAEQRIWKDALRKAQLFQVSTPYLDAMDTGAFRTEMEETYANQQLETLRKRT